MKEFLSIVLGLMLLTSLVGISYATPIMQSAQNTGGDNNSCTQLTPNNPNYYTLGCAGAAHQGGNENPPSHSCTVDGRIGPDAALRLFFRQDKAQTSLAARRALRLIVSRSLTSKSTHSVKVRTELYHQHIFDGAHRHEFHHVMPLGIMRCVYCGTLELYLPRKKLDNRQSRYGNTKWSSKSIRNARELQFTDSHHSSTW